jgi:pimeloyl-ACP methyl ester carboxylesterase
MKLKMMKIKVYLKPKNPIILKVNMIRKHFATLVAFLFLISLDGKSQTVIPRIEWKDLPMVVKKSPDIRTGYLIVPEDRSSKLNKRLINLPFVIIKSQSESPQPDPIIYAAGGPGGVTLFRTRFFQNSPLRENRDIILLEQRGTRFTEPALLGEEIDSALRSGWGTRLNGEPDPQAITAALTTIIHSIEKDGVDLSGYTTKESAADIADLRQLMGIKSWNLYGASYGAKLMLVVLRDYPEGIRSVILDSVLPLEANCDQETPANILEVLERIFVLCHEDENLRARFPDLREGFYKLLAESNLRPIEITLKNPINGNSFLHRLDGAGIMNCIYAGLENTSVIPDIPLIIDAACRGEFNHLAPLAIDYLASSQGTAWGMRIAVWCNEEFPFEKMEKILKPAGLPPDLEQFIQPQVPLEAYQLWPHGQPDANENQPVRSRVPVLIAAGEFDPDTPIKWAYRTKSFLPNAQLVEFAGYSHVPLYRHPEAVRIIREFLANPLHLVDLGKTGERPDFHLSWDEKK